MDKKDILSFLKTGTPLQKKAEESEAVWTCIDCGASDACTDCENDERECPKCGGIQTKCEKTLPLTEKTASEKKEALAFLKKPLEKKQALSFLKQASEKKAEKGKALAFLRKPQEKTAALEFLRNPRIVALTELRRSSMQKSAAPQQAPPPSAVSLSKAMEMAREMDPRADVSEDTDMEGNSLVRIEFGGTPFMPWTEGEFYLGTDPKTGGYAMYDKETDSYQPLRNYKKVLGGLTWGTNSKARAFAASLLNNAGLEKNRRITMEDMQDPAKLQALFNNLINTKREQFGEETIAEQNMPLLFSNLRGLVGTPWHIQERDRRTQEYRRKMYGDKDFAFNEVLQSLPVEDQKHFVEMRKRGLLGDIGPNATYEKPEVFTLPEAPRNRGFVTPPDRFMYQTSTGQIRDYDRARGDMLGTHLMQKVVSGGQDYQDRLTLARQQFGDFAPNKPHMPNKPKNFNIKPYQKPIPEHLVSEPKEKKSWSVFS